MLTRRQFLNLCMALGVAARARGAAPAPGVLKWIELELPGKRSLARRALVMMPADASAGRTYPGLLLFHGRGETKSEASALHAWRSPYGLEESYARLSRPPVVLTPEQRPFMTAAALDALNQRLAHDPFGGLIVICPVTPNPRKSHRPELVLDRYSEWVEHTLLPRVRESAPLDMARGVGVDGCSMGGYVAAEVFVRKPHLFRSFGVVQPAIAEHRVARYARHLARALSRQTLRGVHLQTSTRDPYREAVGAWASHLSRQGARFTLDVLPGNHDQEWLRATGTLAMLAWHEYTLASQNRG